MIQKSANERVQVITRKFARMLEGEVARQLSLFHMRWCWIDYGCLLKDDDHGPRGMDPAIIPYAPFVRSRVYTGTAETGSYNHHSALAKFKDRYYLAWSNGKRNEESAEQRILVSSSPNARRWSEPVCVVGGEEGTVAAHGCLAMRSTPEALYIVGVEEDAIRDATVVGMRRIDPESQRLHLYSSEDGAHWQRVSSYSEQIRSIYEAPRLTSEGRLLCICVTKNGPAALLWPDDDIRRQPEIVPIVQPEGASFVWGEASWYQTDEGRIVIFWRDEGMSCRLYVNWSEDGGRSFSEPIISDIPDSMARVYAGRLSDGRYFLCNNAFPTLLNRLHLMILLGEDGYRFNRVQVLVDDPTSQRRKGLLKTNGYQYPCCLVEDDKLLVAYSVNKEDIECGTVDPRAI